MCGDSVLAKGESWIRSPIPAIFKGTIARQYCAEHDCKHIIAIVLAQVFGTDRSKISSSTNQRGVPASGLRREVSKFDSRNSLGYFKILKIKCFFNFLKMGKTIWRPQGTVTR